MGHESKRLKEAKGKIERIKLYAVDEAFNLLKKTTTVKFDETVDVSIRLGVNPKHADQMVRGAVVLPAGLGKVVRVLVFATGEKAKEAQDAGADYAGGDELVEKIQGGWLDFDTAIAIPPMMAKVGKIGKILGTRGLMPNPKVGTVTMEIAEAVRAAKAGKVQFRVEKAGIVHAPIGKASFAADKLIGNFDALMEAILKAKPQTAKGTYIKGISISSTMGPGIKIDPQAIVTK